MDFQWVMYKAGNLWKATGDMNVGQFILLGLIIYMLPAIIRTVFEVISTLIKSLVRMFMFSIIAGVAINLYLGNGSEIAEMLNHAMKFGKKAIKSVLLPD